jgi:hypothetical protein
MKPWALSMPDKCSTTAVPATCPVWVGDKGRGWRKMGEKQRVIQYEWNAVSKQEAGLGKVFFPWKRKRIQC